MPKMKINVQAHHGFVAKSAKLEEQLKTGGMEIQDAIANIGNYTGIADSDDIENLKKIPGVASVDVIGEAGSTFPDNYSINNQ